MLSLEKSLFIVKEVIILGHAVSRCGVEVYKDKVDVISKHPSPTTVKHIRAFLSHVSYYRYFFVNFSMITSPLTNLLTKIVDFDFDEKCMNAFLVLKQALCSALVVSTPD